VPAGRAPSGSRARAASGRDRAGSHLKRVAGRVPFRQLDKRTVAPLRQNLFNWRMATRILRLGDSRRMQSGVRRARILAAGVAVLLSMTGAARASAAAPTTPTTATTPSTPGTSSTPPVTAGAPIPEGTALWYACTQPVFSGPLFLRCPLPYNPQYLETFLSGFSRFTPENEFKMQFLEPEANHFYFTVADQIARFATEYHKTIRGHTLIWREENPLWLSHPLLPWSRGELNNVMRYYITTVVHHFATNFPGVVTEWDVVNEPLTATGALSSNPWERAIGPSYIRLALDYAHAADPSARLLINTNAADIPGNTETDIFELAASLKQSGAPLSAVGFEGHVTPDTAPSLDQLVSLWKRYAAVGLNVEVTELDVGNDPGGSTQAQKTAVFERYAEACRMAGNCTGFTVWGVADQYSWLGPSADPLLYTSTFQPTPAVPFIRKVLAGGAAPSPPSPDTSKTYVCCCLAPTPKAAKGP
jgi:GH35 family endo-1,4-beta-xylanase